jgi:hypothetical protein
VVHHVLTVQQLHQELSAIEAAFQSTLVRCIRIHVASQVVMLRVFLSECHFLVLAALAAIALAQARTCALFSLSLSLWQEPGTRDGGVYMLYERQHAACSEETWRMEAEQAVSSEQLPCAKSPPTVPRYKLDAAVKELDERRVRRARFRWRPPHTAPRHVFCCD